MRIKYGLIGFACIALTSRAAEAYPTAVIFAPTGEAKPAGDVGALIYTYMLFAPAVGGGQAWFGADVGVLPRIPLGDSGLSFGGLEIGFDAINTDLIGTADAFVKPVFNLKLQLLAEYKWVPHIAVGMMQVDPFRTDPGNRSMNMFYGSLTKTIEVSGTSYGRVTLGLAGMAHKADPTLFYATAPFKKGAPFALLGGYESPAFGPVSLAVDYIGGVSEVSSTNVVVNLTPFDGATWGIGGLFGNDYKKANWYGGMFTYLYINWNVFKVFGSKPSEPPAAAPPPHPTEPATPAAPSDPAAAPAAAPPASPPTPQ